MKFTPETLMAYADGELDAQTRAAIEAAMATDGEIAEQVTRHRALRAELNAAFGGVLQEPIPDRLMTTAQSSAPAGSKVVNLGARRAGNARRWAWPEWTAVAASLLVGVIVGRVAMQRPDSGLAAANDSRIVATGALAAALSEQLGDSTAKTAGISVGLSFRSKTGEYCRTFASNQGSARAGVACRTADQWQIHALAPMNAAPDGDFRMAATQLPPAILQAVEQTIAGDALDAQEEAAARDRDWK